MKRAKLRKLFTCQDCKQDTGEMGEYYMLKNDLWMKINGKHDGMLCIGCFENRLGRQLVPADFAVVPLNHPKYAWTPRSARLQARLTSTQELYNAFEATELG